jgi:hypothetical protein
MSKSDKKIEFAPVTGNVDNDALSKLRDEIENLKRMLKELERQVLMNQRPQSHSGPSFNSSDIEKIINAKLKDILADLNAKIDDLMKLKPRVSKLEKQMKKLKKLILDMLGGHLSPNHSPTREDDAMFSKRPLLGNSCASCDKDIINLIGRSADFFAWQKFPSRDVTDKICKGSGHQRVKTARPNSAIKLYKRSAQQ